MIDVIEALVFDFDGLILDTETYAFETAVEVFADHGVELDRAWWHSILGTAEHPHWSEVLEAALGHPIPERERVLAERTERYHRLLAGEPVRPGVVALLDAAHGEGVACAVASSSSRGWVAGNLERLGLLDRFEALCCRDDVAPGRTKPAPDLFLGACAAVGADPARSVAFEDSPNGVAAALAAGMRVVYVPAGMTAGLVVDRAHHVVTSLADVDLRNL